jgi:D-sedoheptulose 7-phosphate isomerase
MSEQVISLILDYVQEGTELRQSFLEQNAQTIRDIALEMSVSLVKGGKILFCGNGGSAADAQHLAAEFVNRFQLERPPLPALALTTDTSVLTAIGNDYGFEQVFSKQVQALAEEGDVLVAISTSGESPNVLSAVQAAAERGVKIVGMLGKQGGDILPLCKQVLLVQNENTPLIQEVHIAAGHLLCRLVDYYLFEAVAELQPYLQDEN